MGEDSNETPVNIPMDVASGQAPQDIEPKTRAIRSKNISRNKPVKKRRKIPDTPEISDAERRIRWIQSMLNKKPKKEKRDHAWAKAQLENNFTLRKSLRTDSVKELIKDYEGLTVCDRITQEYNSKTENLKNPAVVQVGYMRIGDRVWPVEEIRWNRGVLPTSAIRIVSTGVRVIYKPWPEEGVSGISYTSEIIEKDKYGKKKRVIWRPLVLAEIAEKKFSLIQKLRIAMDWASGQALETLTSPSIEVVDQPDM